jgi:hypothetical protein
MAEQTVLKFSEKELVIGIPSGFESVIPYKLNIYEGRFPAFYLEEQVV